MPRALRIDAAPFEGPCCPLLWPVMLDNLGEGPGDAEEEEEDEAGR